MPDPIPSMLAPGFSIIRRSGIQKEWEPEKRDHLTAGWGGLRGSKSSPRIGPMRFEMQIRSSMGLLAVYNVKSDSVLIEVKCIWICFPSFLCSSQARSLGC